MENKFFGSKLNTVLLLILIILLGVTIWMIKENKVLAPIDDPKQEVKTLDLNEDIKSNTVNPTEFVDEISKIYGSDRIHFISEDEKVYWRTYTNPELGMSFFVPKYCGEPIMNQYYPEGAVLKGSIVQGIFPENCPIRSFSSKSIDFLGHGGDDTSFGNFASKKIPETEFNSKTWGNLKAYMDFSCFYMELGCGNKLENESIDFAFNLKSSKYPSVNIKGKIVEPFRKVIDSIEIK